MERRVNYLLVGAFSLVLVAGLIAFVLWAHHRGGGRVLTSYAIYFDQAVNGLALGSSVRYLGVEVGRVQTIELDSAATPPRVRVTVGVGASIPINQGTVASLKPSGITGVSFIDLHPDPANTKELIVADNQLPVIRAESSGFDQLFSGATNTMQRLDMLLSDENLRHFRDAFNNINEISHRLNKLLEKNDTSLNQFLSELGPTAKVAHDAADSINKDPSQLVFGK